MVEYILHADIYPPPSQTLGVGSIVKNSTFFKTWSFCNSLPIDSYPPPPSALRVKSTGPHSTFSEHGHGVYPIKENLECRNTVANILLAAPPPPDPGLGSIGPSATFSKQYYIVYPMKWKNECSNMVENILRADTYLKSWG